jgi:hypothetical protein
MLFWYMTIMMTTLVEIQNSILVLDSSNEYEIHESQRNYPQRIAFDPQNPGCAH